MSETLACQTGPDGRIHARYPTALRTLCLLEAEGLASSSPQPTCETCLGVARVQGAAVEGACPESWMVVLPPVPAHLHGVEARRQYDRERYARKRAERLAA